MAHLKRFWLRLKRRLAFPTLNSDDAKVGYATRSDLKSSLAVRLLSFESADRVLRQWREGGTRERRKLKIRLAIFISTIVTLVALSELFPAAAFIAELAGFAVFADVMLGGGILTGAIIFRWLRRRPAAQPRKQPDPAPSLRLPSHGEQVWGAGTAKRRP